MLVLSILLSFISIAAAVDTLELVDIQVVVVDNQAVAGVVEDILGVAAVVHRG